jgi:tartrate dehydratase beta subunit/fumarate hydratase class I family protein
LTSCMLLSEARFPAFVVIDDKGNDFFKDLNLG